MPLEPSKSDSAGAKNAKSLFERYGSWIEYGVWILVFAIAYVAMQKVMHPGWTIFGI